uniref:RMI1_C domain-containing protein n=1 Tax=Macrostomum lignano TaxID=282301 RepID=A0A1I8IHP1_9PLAT
MNPSSSGTSLQRQQSYQQQQPQPPRQMSVQEVLDADDLLFAEAIEGIDCDELEAAAVAPSAAASSANRAATSASADRQPLFPSTSTKRPRMELERRAEGRDIAGIPTSKEPFVYLKDVYTWLEESGPQVREFTVRGYLMGLRGRLEIRDGGYSLPCLLADATCTISCNLGDRVLTDLLGFTAAEADAARRSGDSGTLARCQAALLEMQQQLANMAGLFLLAFDIRQETATAIRFRCVTHADVDALRRRVRARKAQERRGGRQQEAGLAAQDDEFLADWDDGLSG